MTRSSNSARASSPASKVSRSARFSKRLRRSQPLATWSYPKTAADKMMAYESVQEMFSRMAAQFGPQPAIERGGRLVTYANLEAESNRLANFLLDGGAGKETMVGLVSDDPVCIITGILGVLKAGAVFVPLDP